MKNDPNFESTNEAIEKEELDDVMTNLLSRLGNLPFAGEKDSDVLKALFQEMDDLQRKIYQRMDDLSKK